MQPSVMVGRPTPQGIYHAMAGNLVYKILTMDEYGTFLRTGSFAGSPPMWRTGSSISRRRIR
ncbi:hypothetical protein RAA17_14505 [Komagataeibacter rhaeticus]|nr:hypothetical protein [Komagataeibacter rhaeticus]